MSLRDPISAVFIFALSTAFFIMSGNYHGGAELFPRGVSAIMMICSALLFIRGLRNPTTGERMAADAVLRVAAVILLTIIYILAVDNIGFVTSSVVFIPLTAYVLGVRNYLMIGLSTFIFVFGVAFLFRQVFYVPLPPELLLTYF